MSLREYRNRKSVQIWNFPIVKEIGLEESDLYYVQEFSYLVTLKLRQKKLWLDLVLLQQVFPGQVSNLWIGEDNRNAK